MAGPLEAQRSHLILGDFGIRLSQKRTLEVTSR
jgi:hypothetical protein